MVRYGKNGSDATTAAIRLARAFTGKEEVAVCGYHGWHDWYIGSTDKKLGVPNCVQQLTHSFQYNDIDSLKSIVADPNTDLAAVIMEPMNVCFPDPGFLQAVRDLCTEQGIVLIFDETVTGFRLSLNGAQGLFGVTPDLATFGKGIANGMPLSVVCGRKDIMSMLDEVFFSFTYGGELLSIAAALEVINKLEQTAGLKQIEMCGHKLKQGLENLLEEYQLADVLQVSGHPSWSFLLFKISDESEFYLWKTLFMQEALSQGLLTLGSHNLTLSHDEGVIDEVLRCYDNVFRVLSKAKNEQNVQSFLRVEPLTPLFTVRKK
jgi:glutamate-1-semialdehyde 2,1-aminomutase